MGDGYRWGISLFYPFLPFWFNHCFDWSFFGASMGLFMVIFFEMAHIKQEMHKEKIKHTRLLEQMVKLLKQQNDKLSHH